MTSTKKLATTNYTEKRAKSQLSMDFMLGYIESVEGVNSENIDKILDMYESENSLGAKNLFCELYPEIIAAPKSYTSNKKKAAALRAERAAAKAKAGTAANNITPIKKTA